MTYSFEINLEASLNCLAGGLAGDGVECLTGLGLGVSDDNETTECPKKVTNFRIETILKIFGLGNQLRYPQKAEACSYSAS